MIVLLFKDKLPLWIMRNKSERACIMFIDKSDCNEIDDMRLSIAALRVAGLIPARYKYLYGLHVVVPGLGVSSTGVIFSLSEGRGTPMRIFHPETKKKV